MSVVSLSEASRCTGISRTQLYRQLNRGDLKAWERGFGPRGERLLEMDGLRERCLSTQRARIDTLHWEAQCNQPEKLQSPVGLHRAIDLRKVAEWANASLDPSTWGAPPWALLRWLTLLHVWEEAQDLQLQNGDFTIEKWERLESLAEVSMEGGI